jgi:hypothetical protein
VVFGLWKGDLTLKRAIVSALDQAQRNGEIATIIARYSPGAADAQAPVMEGSARQDGLPQDRLGRRK